MNTSSAPPLRKYHARLCSRKRPTMLRMRMFADPKGPRRSGGALGALCLSCGGSPQGLSGPREFWRILYDDGADVVLGAHDHFYERFAPQDPDGAADPAKGIREFIVGTGGAPPYQFVDVKPNSEVRLSTIGVLRLALKAGGYDWNFIAVNGPGDSGSATCH
jgi:hypothetical protein